MSCGDTYQWPKCKEACSASNWDIAVTTRWAMRVYQTFLGNIRGELLSGMDGIQVGCSREAERIGVCPGHLIEVNQQASSCKFSQASECSRHTNSPPLTCPLYTSHWASKTLETKQNFKYNHSWAQPKDAMRGFTFIFIVPQVNGYVIITGMFTIWKLSSRSSWEPSFSQSQGFIFVSLPFEFLNSLS